MSEPDPHERKSSAVGWLLLVAASAFTVAVYVGFWFDFNLLEFVPHRIAQAVSQFTQ